MFGVNIYYGGLCHPYKYQIKENTFTSLLHTDIVRKKNMVRPPVPDAMKGRWTPGEDFMLASYVHEHGASNWNLVPRNTGICVQFF